MDNEAVRVKQLFEKAKSKEKKGMDVRGMVEELGFNYANIFPANVAMMAADGAKEEIVQLRVDHHEKKRLKLLVKLMHALKKKKNNEKSIRNASDGLVLSRGVEELNKEIIELKQKRRIEASERALKLKFTQKIELLKKIRDKQAKSVEQRNKYNSELREKIDKFQREERNKYELVKQNSIVICS